MTPGVERSALRGWAFRGDDPATLAAAGDLPHSTPSTVVDCTSDTPRVVREGVVPIDRLRCALPDLGPAPRDRTGPAPRETT